MFISSLFCVLSLNLPFLLKKTCSHFSLFNSSYFWQTLSFLYHLFGHFYFNFLSFATKLENGLKYSKLDCSMQSKRWVFSYTLKSKGAEIPKYVSCFLYQSINILCRRSRSTIWRCTRKPRCVCVSPHINIK